MAFDSIVLCWGSFFKMTFLRGGGGKNNIKWSKMISVAHVKKTENIRKTLENNRISEKLWTKGHYSKSEVVRSLLMNWKGSTSSNFFTVSKQLWGFSTCENVHENFKEIWPRLDRLWQIWHIGCLGPMLFRAPES